MRLVFLGPPGAGKGTQAERLSEERRIPHIATGDILRSAISRKTPVGLEAKSFMDAGKLVPDDVIIKIIRERLKEPDTKNGYILDGFPRTINQAEALSKILSADGQAIDRVLYFDLNEDELIKRIAGRRSCPSCQNVYHTAFHPPRQEGVCDHCGKSLFQRKDDAPETVKERLAVYKRETAPLISHYQKQGRLSTIDAGGTMEEVLQRLEQAITQAAS
jgi:adenylate kinase